MDEVEDCYHYRELNQLRYFYSMTLRTCFFNEPDYTGSAVTLLHVTKILQTVWMVAMMRLWGSTCLPVVLPCRSELKSVVPKCVALPMAVKWLSAPTFVRIEFLDWR
jgi:hypothetical protein